MKITLGTLKDQGEDLATFLEPRVGAKPLVSGGTLEVEDASIRAGVRPRHVKTYIKRFMYMKGVRKKYRVFVAGKELTVQEIELGEEGKEEEKKVKMEEGETAPKEESSAEAKEEPAAEKSQEKPRQEKKAPSKKSRAKKKAEPKD